MELKKIVLHQIIRENNNDPELHISDHLLTVDEITIKFMETLIKSYTSKNPTYGTFDSDITNNPFQKSVKNYFQDHDFIKFSKEAMDTLKKAINKPQAKGGYVVFSHYNESNEDFIVTVMLDNSIRFVVDKKLDINKLLGLDIDKVARANRINWQQWGDKRERYLSFIKGTRGVSDYFAKDFIGCTDYTSAKENAKALHLAINDYMNSNEFDDNKKRKTRQRLKEYTDRQIDNKEDIMIDAISACINTESPRHFVEYVSENCLEIGNFISTSKSDFKGFTTKKIKGIGYKLEYQRNAENIILDKDNKTITITAIPAKDFDD